MLIEKYKLLTLCTWTCIFCMQWRTMSILNAVIPEGLQSMVLSKLVFSPLPLHTKISLGSLNLLIFCPVDDKIPKGFTILHRVIKPSLSLHPLWDFPFIFFWSNFFGTCSCEKDHIFSQQYNLSDLAYYICIVILYMHSVFVTLHCVTGLGCRHVSTHARFPQHYWKS